MSRRIYEKRKKRRKSRWKPGTTAKLWWKGMRMLTGMLWGILFGVFFLSGLAFLAGRQIYYETSDSMEPVIRKGSMLFVREKDDYGIGDIVAFYTEFGGQALCVTHRIVDKGPDGSYGTKGDANARADEQRLYQEQIRGQVTEYIPYFGYIGFFIQKNSGPVFLLLCLSACVEIYWLSQSEEC